MREVYHALGLHMHQPPGNIDLLLRENELEAKQIILCYERPLKYVKRYEGSEIIVIPRDRDISNAQESGFNPDWFENGVMHKTKECEGNCLVTTWSDGENGGWFRQMHEPSGFWGHFFAPYMEKVKSDATIIKPVTISEFVKETPPEDYVHVRTGAWNVANRSGYDFSQWQGSETQRKGLEEIWSVSKRFHELANSGKLSEEMRDKLEELVLRAKPVVTSSGAMHGFTGCMKIRKKLRG